MAEAARSTPSLGLSASVMVEAMEKQQQHSAERFRQLYPEVPEKELEIARENFRRYVALALRIYEAIREDPERYAQFRALTAAEVEATLESKSPH